MITVDMQNTLARYINKPWSNGARGPNSFDCWGLIYYFYHNELNILLPSYPNIDANSCEQVSGCIMQQVLQDCWKQLAQPEPYCVVVMSTGNIAKHVGLYLPYDKGIIVHCDTCGVRVLPLRYATRFGWNNLTFYKFKEQ